MLTSVEQHGHQHRGDRSYVSRQLPSLRFTYSEPVIDDTLRFIEPGELDVARLEVMSLYEEVVEHDKGEREILVHVIARTAATPHVYFYRWRRADSSWTAWEKLELSIDAEQVVLVV